MGRSESLSHLDRENSAEDSDTYWDSLTTESGSIGIDDSTDEDEQPKTRVSIPSELTFAHSHPDQEPISVPLEGIGSDELYLLPSKEEFTGRYWQIYQTTTPKLVQSTERGGTLVNYMIARYSHELGNNGKYMDMPDAVRLTNVSALFD